MRMIPSATLRDVAAAVERYEKADAEMRRGWPEPRPDVVEQWNNSRRLAESLLAMVVRDLR